LTILGEILPAKRRRVSAGEFARHTAPPGERPEGAPFAASLSSPSKKSSSSSSSFLCEIKHRSPSAGVILLNADARIEDIARAYRRGGAAALSVVVEQDFFGGDPAWLPRAKAASGLPVLMKDFVVDECQLDFASALGADAVLLIAAALGDADLARLHAAAKTRGLAVLVEAHDESEVRRVAAVGAEIVGVNSRDLATFAVDLAGMARLGALLPETAVRVAESGIRTRADVEALEAAGYGAFLVGETLLRSPDPARTLRELRGENATEVKICGVTREEDVDACLANGVDWIGLIFAAKSPRRVTPEEGRFLRMRARGEGDRGFLRIKGEGEPGDRRESGVAPEGAAGAVKGVVAVFDEESHAAEIERIVSIVRPDVIQMPVPSSSLSKKISSSEISVWNTVRVGRDDLEGVVNRAGSALHFDTSVAGVGGGTGRTFDWSVLDAVGRTRPLVLAGGLTPANVAEAVRRVRPDVVDVASGVESSPGVKDPGKIAAFVREVRRA
jgi:indole-3-glycerol phosphate synthase/phosphoribosylanthranilate isomerase